MLDLNFVRENLPLVEEKLRQRGLDPAAVLKDFREVDTQRRQAITEAETSKAQRNKASEEIAELKKSGQDASAAMAQTKDLREKIQTLEKTAADLDAPWPIIPRALPILLLAGIPNLPHASVPIGHSAEQNVEVRRWGSPPKFDFTPKAHWDLGAELGILDLDRVPPGDKDLWLIPTAEVPVTNLYRDEVLDQARLPVSLTAYTPCFRSEAGSYGKDVRGIIRQHQFQKVELVKFTRPENSYEEHEKLTRDAEEVLQKLGLHYRTMALCTGDMGPSSAKTYDIEVWLPGQQLFREISSCSNFESSQARRANIRYRPEGKNKTEFVHTLNGSGLAVGRTWVAIVENYQQADGSVVIPEVLRPYIGAEKITPKKF